MTEAAKNARREYKKAWAKRNPEKVKEYQRSYWERVAAAEPAKNSTDTTKPAQQ